MRWTLNTVPYGVHFHDASRSCARAHEHADQADYFTFLGPSTFKIFLWDSRKNSTRYAVKQVLYAGEDAPRSAIIPPGVFHAYKNVGRKLGMVVNSPDRLSAGKRKKEKVDGTRHEKDLNTIFIID